MEIDDIEVCDDWMEKVEDRVLVSDMLDSCSLRSRELEVIKMRYWYNMTFSAIGNRLKVSGARVCDMLGRGMRRIRCSTFARLIKSGALTRPIKALKQHA
jgi:DNA-directed RNA polymerase sigma subunit (sigma70/sigma32)